jgi:hypothetical protein
MLVCELLLINLFSKPPFIHVFNQEPWNDAWTKETATQYILDFTNFPGFMGIVAADGEEIIGIIFGTRKVCGVVTSFLSMKCV